MKANPYVFFFVFFVLISCSQEVKNRQEKLWVDNTEIYLPVTAEWTNRVEVADINGDDKVDLLFANGGNYSDPGDLEYSRIFINQGPDQKFKEVTKDVFGGQKFISRVIKARDINNDSIIDIIIGNTYQKQSHLLIGTGEGTFQDVTATNFPQILASVGDLELGDVDMDGDLDVVLADWGQGNNMNNSGGRTMLWINDGKGKFTDQTASQMPETLIQFSWDLEFFDFDNDFDLDIAISCKRCASSKIFVNDGKGHFEDKRLLPAYTNNYDFEMMDVNNDGFLDMITINDGEIVGTKSYSRREHIFINEEGERFIDATTELWPDAENIGEDDNNIVFLDYDSDDDADFLISSLTGEDRLLINDGEGKFKLEQPVLFGDPTPLTLSMVLADINNDDKPDIIMGQGEGDEGIEERIFIANDLKPDTGKPVISHSILTENSSGEKWMIKARIHDYKTPNMPHDWDEVYLSYSESNEKTPMQWYGENLWAGSINKSNEKGEISICAKDKAQNESCVVVNKESN
jgi:hypothetical protein